MLEICAPVLESSASGFEQRNSLREVADLATQGANVVRQLLAFSRQSAMNARPLDLARQLAGFSKVIRRVASERVAVEAESRGMHVCADGTRLVHAQFLGKPAVS